MTVKESRVERLKRELAEAVAKVEAQAQKQEESRQQRIERMLQLIEKVDADAVKLQVRREKYVATLEELGFTEDEAAESDANTD